MPSPYDRSAPRFDGQPRSLKRFLDEIEILGRDCNVTEQDLITHTLRYLDSRDEEIWRGPALHARGDWGLFKIKIITLYPGAEDEHRYTVTDLQIIAENQAAIPMRDRFQFGEYYRQFVTKSDWLLARGVISRREQSKLFLSGLHVDFRNQVRIQLRLSDPLHPLDDTWTMSDIERAARFLLNSDNGGAPLALPSFVTQTTPSYPTAPLIPTPRETFDMSSIEQFLVSDTFLNKLAGKIGGQNNSGDPSLQRNHYSYNLPQTSQQRPPPGCAFCWDPEHYIRNCNRLADYLKRGLCTRDNTNRICLPDGTLVTHQVAPGRYIMERIDNWHRSRPAPPPTVQTNILEAIPIHSPSSEPSMTALPSHVASHFNSTTVQDQQELEILERVTIAALKRRDQIENRSKATTKPKTNPTTSNPAQTKPTPNRGSQISDQRTSATKPTMIPSVAPSTPIPPTHPASQPQYRYSTPIEDPVLTQNIIQRSLDTPISITIRELYSAAPEARKYIKDQLTTRRIPMGPTAAVSALEQYPDDGDDTPHSTFTHQTLPPPGPLVVANQVEELRTIPLELNGKLTVDAILDEGSQITAIRRDIWERLAFPLLSTQTMVMEAANSSKDSTLGLLRDLPARIGRSTFYLQVQVVENASYEMLLGRPFLTLTEARTHHYTNGDSHLTLVDPNTHDTFTIPTKPRIRQFQQSNSGF